LTAGRPFLAPTTRLEPGSTPCGGNSDEKVIKPIFELYDAIAARDIVSYSAQWADEATYMRADTGAVKSREQKISDRRAEFARWRSATITKEKVSVLEKTATTAVVDLIYTLRIEYLYGNVSQDSHVLERYDVQCNAAMRVVNG
jgi:hypothetical protein